MKEISCGRRTRVSFGKSREPLPIPDLVEIQKSSYRRFLEEGLLEVLKKFSPIYSQATRSDLRKSDRGFALEFVSTRTGEPAIDPLECKAKGLTYSVPIYATARLTDMKSGEMKEEEVFLGYIPYMTDRGTFIINGAERVVVNQIVVSPGLYFSSEYIDREEYGGYFLPSRGAWLEVILDPYDGVLYAGLDGKKVNLFLFLKTIGYEKDEDILSLYPTYLDADDEDSLLLHVGSILLEDIYDGGRKIAEKWDILTKDLAERILMIDDINQIKIVHPIAQNTFEKMLEVVSSSSEEGEEEEEKTKIYGLNEVTVVDAYLEIFRRLRPEELPRINAAKRYLHDLFFNPERYDLSEVGRYKVNERLRNAYIRYLIEVEGEDPEEARKKVYNETSLVLKPLDIVLASRILFDYFERRYVNDFEIDSYELKNLIRIFKEEYLEKRKTAPYDLRKLVSVFRRNYGVTSDLGVFAAIRYVSNINKELPSIPFDTKDHLGNKRVRTVGELVQREFERLFARAQKAIQERLTLINSLSKVSIQSLINIKSIISTVNQFFAMNQLSQFMDQVNPLSELTHKRRVSAVGPGGLRRESKVFEARNVHYSQYGRLCPIETPEGANIGFITSLAIYAKIDEYGFLMTPYRKVVNGKVTDEVVYLRANEEEEYKIIPATTPVDEEGNIIPERVVARMGEDIRLVPKEEVDFMDVSTKQPFSVSASLIPFLEHDDASRALMGSNMQRQAVPLLKTEAPLVGTGMEWEAAKNSGYVILAEHDGIVKEVDAARVVVHRTDENGNLMYDDKGNPVVDEYRLLKFVRSNQDTMINQKPIVNEGDFVKKGDPIADGPATDMGELALGRNILVAFMPWEGYNYEDAILVSQELLEEDVFTSIHIEVYETQARETRLGPEEITADIPNVSKELLKNLDENGIIRVGAYVVSDYGVGSQAILVGKVTPKGEGDTTPEEKIIRSVFGERGRDVKDTSLRLPHGVEGRVIRVDVYDQNDIAELGAGVLKLVRVYVASRKTLDIGDKLAGRHGNKGVVSNILPKEDMPFLPDGTPVQMVLNPLGIPSRMNVGQILETHLGWLAKLTGKWFATPVFEGAKEDEILRPLYEERKKRGLHLGDDENNPNGKVVLRDGRTGEPFDNPVVVGYMYMLKLIHIAKEKIHARSTGPYSLIHQQPLGGKSHFGGQRLGEMEVWALEAYGAAHTLAEMLTIKSDDIKGRNEAYKAILKNMNIPEPGVPESFRVLIKELRGLALDVRLYDENGNEIDIDKY
ncbi:DNA-directed RNA polymerase subunit beta [Thermotoga maritima MSB8]|uniref:DNA-directed RNA polymerase subunit beta n=1 Tax=Thermotoga maritima (strain ATCC 43589 / DSM 3109 / JCM 10099 / NBRC 100826 / MSB8) TaxID=243274 RepID=RPOB_THEMA|nr:DNA-directed RNA polymerase subunit beta [Thermotoga maritima]P29398.2 RecName: Full=DNA-directed RNA polymerase subunit beta; Short=RNAP subunit beta; AltName: Full=RNA polymerase subunit beta; AltName: Full=Transcriptase subunit beta [Thermotoga maritima MSB8]AAD35543.1 DNA-directed RNA polymerase, beta subunit [Thermotoga maritima MSB8]AHD17784.1 DNA-directed RNA polymerase subunit beta [Thermotoga maritima MSB8]AKE26385.1 DNA-directed RNA polymerase subunit beta [Thermotoga maritima]AKE